MGRIKLAYSTERAPTDGGVRDCLTQAHFGGFDTRVLGLGQISRDASYVQALAAMFDLQGFTDFCNQIDPHLVVPEYLDQFLSWLFDEVRRQLTVESTNDKVYLWARLPFYAKFMGDGVLFLWDTQHFASPSEYGNIVSAMDDICDAFGKFRDQTAKEFARVPRQLRCGLARGQVIAVGDGADYVGPCINMAARLQKLGSLCFAFPRRGFNPERCFDPETRSLYIPKRVAVRGIGEEEIIMIRQAEFEKLKPEDAGGFLDV